MNANLHFTRTRRRFGDVRNVEHLRRSVAVVAKGAHDGRSVDVERVLLQCVERNDGERFLVCRRENDRRRDTRLESLAPGRGAHAPAISGNEARKAEGRHRGEEIVALLAGKGEEFGRDLRADHVQADILRARVAAAVAIEAGHGLKRTDFQRLTEHIAGWGRSSASIATVISEHNLVPLAVHLSIESL